MQKEMIGNHILYCGDCREIMPQLAAVDAIITDPVWTDNNVKEFKHINPYRLFRAAYKSFPEHKRSAYLLNCDSDPLLLKPVKEKFIRAMWLRYVLPGHKGRILNSGLVGYCFGTPPQSVKGQRLISGEVSAGGWMSKKKRREDHPCCRRQEHIDFVVYQMSRENETVLDPFMGSATTGIACIKYNRKFIGIEKEQKFFDVACREIEEEMSQQKLF